MNLHLPGECRCILNPSNHNYKVLLNGKVTRECGIIDAESVELHGGTIELLGGMDEHLGGSVVVVAGTFRDPKG